jgi:hypothetical protein
MANINDNIRGKKLFKSGSSGQDASKGGDGEITISSEKATELNALTDVSEMFNDEGLYQNNKFLLRQVEDLRLDVEELHAFIKAAFGKDSSSAASQGAKGDTGATGATGAKGDKGDKGDTGATGATGPQGPAGADGADGSDASVSGASGSFTATSGKSTVTVTVSNGLISTIK